MKKIIYAALLTAMTMTACSDNAYNPGEPAPPQPTADNAVDKNVTIDITAVHQTMAGFGASDCWMPAWIGKYWTGSRDAISELLFSQEIVDGQPKGIGLSMWRVNTGAGSAEQGDDSGITTVVRRAESFMTADGSLDWEKCPGQRYFMERAKAMGVEKFVLFSNSPLVQYTYNGQARSDRGGKSNLKPEHYGDYAEYLAQVAAHFTAAGYNITHISPINEPQWSWNGTDQEGSAWTPDESAKLFRALDGALTAHGLSTDILVGEAADWNFFCGDKSCDSGNTQIPSHFYEPGSSSYIGDLQHVKPLFCGHSYWTDTEWESMRNTRRDVASTAAQYGLEVWQSEWCMLGDGHNKDEYAGHDVCSDMDRAIYMTKVMHNDITVGNVTSWCYWVAMDYRQVNNRYLLVYLTPAGGSDGDVFAGDGTYAPAANLWAMGNFSLFVRPGFKRVDLNLTESCNFFGSAYISPDGKRVVAVYTNVGNKPVRLNETHTGFGTAASVRTYTTSVDKQLKEAVVAQGESVVLDAKSVTTVVYDF